MKTLVIGASENPERYANKAIHKLRKYNHEVVGIGARAGKVLDVAFDKTHKAFDHIDTVTLYIGPRHQPDYYQYIISLQPKRVIFNPGTENEEFYNLLNKAGISYEIACTLVLLSTNQY